MHARVEAINLKSCLKPHVINLKSDKKNAREKHKFKSGLTSLKTKLFLVNHMLQGIPKESSCD